MSSLSRSLGRAAALVALCGALCVPVASAIAAPTRRPAAAPGAAPNAAGLLAAAPCATPLRRSLDFWVGDWAIYEGGRRVATQRVHRAVDGCALTAEWSGSEGDRGLGVFYFDDGDRSARQLWLANQVPAPSAPMMRRLSPTYRGPGVRYESEPVSAARRDRLTLTPLTGGRARQVVEASADGGRTWRVVLDAEHRPLR